MLNFEELKEKKITMNQMFIFQELLNEIKITLIADDIIKRIKDMSKDNYTKDELNKIESIGQITDNEEKIKKLKAFKASRTLRMGIEVNITVKNYIYKNLYKCQELFMNLLEQFTGSKNLDMDDMLKVFSIMWNNGLHKIAFMYLQEKDLYAKKK